VEDKVCAMSISDYLVINRHIVADDFDDEMVLIDVRKGLYFSMRGSAPDIWKCFTEPRSKSSLLDELAQEVGEDRLQSVSQAVDKMLEHELLVSASPPESGRAVLLGLAAPTFALPVIDVFTDMAELIAIDPVHEVDEAAGWPVRPANFPTQA
jgi:hypothetical protein